MRLSEAEFIYDTHRKIKIDVQTGTETPCEETPLEWHPSSEWESEICSYFIFVRRKK